MLVLVLVLGWQDPVARKEAWRPNGKTNILDYSEYALELFTKIGRAHV